MATFLLVHGAWHGAWCWDRLTPLLRERGHKVAAFDLPCHGQDRGGWWRASMGRYVARIRIVAEQLGEPPILVGHSMGGMEITRAAAEAPSLYRALHYLCAFVPLAGDSLIRLARLDEESLVPRHTTIRPWGVHFHGDGVAETFAAGCDEETRRSAAERLRRIRLPDVDRFVNEIIAAL